MRQRIPIEQVVFILGCLFLLTVVALYVLRRLFRKHGGARSIPDLADRKLNNIYSRSIGRGLQLKNLVRVYSQMDTALILSLLSSVGIPTNILYPRMNNLRTGVAIRGYNDSIIRVLYPDHARAKGLVGSYIKERKANGNIPIGFRFLNLVEFFVGGVFINPRAPIPELFEQNGRPHPRCRAVVGKTIYPRVRDRKRQKVKRQAYVGY